MKKTRNDQGFAPVTLLILIIIAAGAIYGGSRLIKKPVDLLKVNVGSNQPTSVPTGGMKQQVSPKEELPNPADQQVLVENFNKTGGLTDWDANFEKQTGNWVLLYDEPGRLALTAKLAFNAASICDLGDGEKPCDPAKFTLGAYTNVRGNEQNGAVTVIKLTKMAGPQ